MLVSDMATERYLGCFMAFHKVDFQATLPNGDYYEGKYENGKRHGDGIYKFKVSFGTFLLQI